MIDRIVTYMGDGSFLPILLCSRPSLRDCEMLTNLRLKLQCSGHCARGLVLVVAVIAAESPPVSIPSDTGSLRLRPLIMS